MIAKCQTPEWQVKDLRNYFENDMRFLREFETFI